MEVWKTRRKRLKPISPADSSPSAPKASRLLESQLWAYVGYIPSTAMTFFDISLLMLF
jgi:hypothetical protein